MIRLFKRLFGKDPEPTFTFDIDQRMRFIEEHRGQFQWRD